MSHGIAAARMRPMSSGLASTVNENGTCLVPTYGNPENRVPSLRLLSMIANSSRNPPISVGWK
jgi:hypothetical protein